MECTQRLECTQDLNPEPYSQRSGPEQIGYLGILGNTYPVNHGPNKIGRDPQTCSIVLDMKSLSRQHAVINVLNKKQFMLMDLGSINKTKIGVKTLQPYIPYPLQNGDTVQFGDVFGIFRLFEDDTDLPMTQDIGVPDTPVLFRHVSKLGASTSTVTTIVPESPDVSDKDDSFIVSSQQTKEPEFKSPKNHFLKPSARTIMKPSIGTNQINNDFWNSAEKSPSLKLNLDDSSESLNDSSSSSTENNTIKTVVSNNKTAKDIHEMETQVPYGNDANETTESIYTANTQLPPSNSPSIHTLETQLQLPVVRKINEQHEMQFELSIDNKENDVSVHNAHTQMFGIKDIYNVETQAMSSKNNESIHNANTELFEDKDINKAETQSMANKSKEKCIHDVNTQLMVNKVNELSVHDVNTQMFNNYNEIVNKEEAIEEDNSFYKKNSIINIIDEEKISESDEELLFGEFDNTDIEIEMPCDKQSSNVDKDKHRPQEKRRSSNDLILLNEADDHEFDNSQPLLLIDMSPNKSSDKENMPVINSESSSPLIGVKRNKMRIDSDSSSDCDDFAILPTQKIVPNTEGDDDETDCEDMISNKLEPKNDHGLSVSSEVTTQIRLEEMATQILDEKVDECCFEDMPTQIISDDHTESDLKGTTSETYKSNADCYEDMSTQIIVGDVPNENEPVFSEEVVSPFKIPFLSPKKMRKRDISKLTTKSISYNPNSNSSFTSESKDENDDKYYEATQDIIHDLCSQSIPSPKRNNSVKDFKEDDEVVPCSVEDFEVGDRFRHIDNQVSPQKSLVVADRSSDSTDSTEKVDKYVSSLSSHQINDIVGVSDKSVSTLIKKSSSDLSDLEVTPKKYNPLKFMNIELPNSQEIKTNVTWSKFAKTESSSDSEQDTQESQECTPILFKKKVRTKKADAKMDLINKFNADALPARVITRVRKPTAKVQESTESIKKVTETILKPKFLTEQEDNIDKDIITENITRLKNKKNKSLVKPPSDHKIQSVEIDTQNKPSKESADKKIKDTKHNNRKSAEKDKVTAEKSVPILAKNKTSKNDNKSSIDKGQSKNEDKSKTTTVNILDISKIKDIRDKKNRSRETKENARKSEEKEKNKLMQTENDKESQSKICDFYEKEPPKEDRRSRSKKSDSNTRISNEKSKSKKEKADTKNILETKEIEEIINIDSEPEDNKQTKTIRSTRNKKKTESKSKSPEKIKEPQKRKYTKRTKKSASPPPPPENTNQIRRSKRQKVLKDSQDSQYDSQNEKTTRSIIKSSKDSETKPKSSLTRDQSTIYNISTESNPESPKSRKRTATENLEMSIPKRTRSAMSNTSTVSSRATPAKTLKTLNVLFTAFSNEEVKTKLVELGAVVVTDVNMCSVLVTLQIKRTFKLLCIVGLGKPIVGPSWVQACVDTNILVDPWLYLMRDEAAETRFHFNLERTLTGPRAFLQGYNVSSTPSVIPRAAEMKLIVGSSGGTWKEGGPHWICVSTPSDKPLWPSLRRMGAILVSTELILGGVLRQKLDIEANKFSCIYELDSSDTS